MQLPFFYETILPQESSVLTVSEQTSKHCIQVLRMQLGEKILLTNGTGWLTEATIITADKKRMAVQTSVAMYKEPATIQTTLAISFVKNPSRIEWLLEKATEIGVVGIVPLICERSEKTVAKSERWDNILISAMLQSKQVYKPILHKAATVKELLAVPFSGSTFIAHCLEGTKPLAQYLPLAAYRRVLIGPEGDFTRAEIATATDAGCLALDLGQTRLRTETAGLVAVTLLQHH
ncbi:MAG: 16S rRNA (uracil(1498)-N(3))-methyltransferase [Sediminibacterium sp.]|jgi:16S rRNA (uracil1498-N3)-methyltransferase|nr:16S rRNA (uracil(1498)-N(3))-methyltransferase [Sediminibacterium sp.]MBX9779846.1 16S rRNA (uracil(1498)-N(3))-methyltransferase [Chitinophagaceae bacterium]